MERQQNDKRCPAFARPLHPDGAAKTFNRTGDNGEAEASALSWLLGGEERLKDPFFILWCNASPGIGDDCLEESRRRLSA